MTANAVILVLLLLTLKHFICDFPLQMFPFMYKNKGTYGHIGGVLHAAIHAFGTMVVLSFVLNHPMQVMFIALFDGVVHYHIDWLKMRLNERWRLGPTTSEWYWVLLGADQLLHALTYLFIVWMMV